MGKATAQGVCDNFKKCSTSLDDKKIIQVSSDGPNVDLTFLNLIRENRKENNLPELLEIGTRGLHIVHRSFKYDLNESGTSIKFFLLCGRYLINLLPEKPILNPRLVETIRSSSVLKMGWKWKSFTKGYSGMASIIARQLDSFLVQFQTDEPMVPFLCQRLEDIMCWLVSELFLKMLWQRLTLVSVLLRWVLKVIPFTNAERMLLWELLPSLKCRNFWKRRKSMILNV